MLIVHSDLALDRVRRLLPEAVIVAPCHSDKFARKARADLIITLNPAQHELVRAGMPQARVALLGNPYVAPPAPFATASGPPRINFVGRFVAAKDPFTLLRAAALTNRGSRPEYRFIGSGPLETKLRRAAAGSAKNITFAGWMASPVSAFHQNDVLVLPSVWEGLPYLLQEALHRGVPIIASDIPGNRTALGGGRFGLLFPPGEAGALARAIETALLNLDGLRSRSRVGALALRSRYGAVPFWFALNRAVAHSFKQGRPDKARGWRAASASGMPRAGSDPVTTSLPARKQEPTPNFLRELREEPLPTDG
jgi:glycosyltransferase involved in cell wall biosynthesis